MKIVETDNFAGDYPDEKFVNIPPTTQAHAEAIAAAINNAFCNHDNARRYWKVENDDYKLQPGF